MSTRTPLHLNSRTEKPWTARMAEVVDLWTTNAAINPNGFRQFRTGKHHKGRGPAPKTRLERISELDAKLA